MYQTVLSQSARWAGSASTEPGLHRALHNPVLCCPVVAAVGLATAVMSGAVEYATTTASQSADGSGGEETAVLTPTAVNGYIAPGQITSSDMQVRDDASVEQLISVSDARA